MRNTSIFQGWKELTDGKEAFRFEDRGTFWHVYRCETSGIGERCFVHCGVIEAHTKASNRALFEEALQRFAN